MILTIVIILLILSVFGFLEKSNMNIHFKLFISALILFESVSMILLPKENMAITRSLLFFSSSIYLIRSSYEIKKSPTSEPRSLALDYIFKNIISISKLPYLGVILTFVLLYFNIFIFEVNPSAEGPSTKFGINDQIILFFSFNCILYPFISEKYNIERDFILLFSSILLVIFIFPQVLIMILSEFYSLNLESSYLRSLLLARPISIILNLTGYDSVDNGEYIYFRLIDGQVVHLFVAERCSGLHSVVIFLSAFFSYILTEAKKFEIEYLLLAIFGLFASYFANLFRMYSIILIGHYKGLIAMDWAHANLGWIIFFLWMALFWNIAFRKNIND